jgi:glycosyltransferase involved in cell wall biosynthesis
MLVFFGAMGRSENYLSVKWFVEEVFNHLNGMYQLVIIGGNPPEFVKMYASDNVTVTGFVPQSKVEEYFGRCTCMVVPLKLGSGIKVKVLEAFSASIPVITNSIGNEGVFAREKTEYIRCETAQEYIDFLTQLQDNNDIQYIGENARRYVDEAFNLEKSKDDYIAKIGEVIGDSKR